MDTRLLASLTGHGFLFCSTDGFQYLACRGGGSGDSLYMTV